MIRSRYLWAVLPFLAVTAACDSQTGAWGDENSIVAAVDSTLWAEIGEVVVDGLEPTVFTVTDEKRFTVTHQDPADEFWNNLRRFRQMLVIGTEDQPHVADALAKVRGRDSFSAPEIVQAQNVWARNQNVTVLLLSESGGLSEVMGLLDELAAQYDRQFVQTVQQRMFLTGADTALADTLMTQFGFSVTVPNVYFWDQRDSVIILRNDNPDPAELIRQIAVTWRTPIPDPEIFQADSILGWRTQLAAEHYSYPQLNNLDRVQGGPGMLDGRQVYEIQATWQNPPDSGWPAGGPFILRAIVCPEQDRMYLVDSWLYAPGKEKYEFMIQLQTILDSFRCGAA